MHSYHLKDIEKGFYGHESKIREEFLEFEDSINQNNAVMSIMELSDLIGAIEGYVKKYNLTLDDLIRMMEATKRAFQSGERK